MPPQSRGKTPESRSFSAPNALPPTLKPFLDNLPRPNILSPSQSAPVGNPDDVDDEDNTLTPVRPRFNLDVEDEEEDEDEEEEEEEEDEDEDEDEDEEEQDDSDSSDENDFGAYHTQKSSPAQFEHDSDEAADVVEVPFSSRGSGEPLHRISSLPSTLSHNGQAAGMHTSHSTTSLPRAAPPIPPPLYPPFYNRPPTPLPPSPSLTSLLRPPSLLNRSTTSTRPTTPDSSDAETPNDTEAAVAHSARRANPLPPTSPKVPTYEYYGFVLYLASTLFFLMYIFWSYLPSPFLHALGITYYPNRWWSLAIPAWIVMLLIYIYIALACWNLEYLTLGLSQVETMVDDAGNIAILDEIGRVRKGGSKRLEVEMEESRRRERFSSTWTKKGKGSGRKKDHKRRQREDKEFHRFGYMGEVFDGKVASGLTWRQIWNEGTDAVMDVPIGGVCEVLYGEGRDSLP